MRFDDITYRPIDLWPGELTSEYARRRAPFSSEWYSTMRLLERELEMLAARNAIFQVALDERDFRIDGKPRAQAKARHPGVILAFESKYGPIKFAIDTFTRWQDNIRAIAPTGFCSAVVGLFAVAGPGGPDAWRFFLGGAVVGGIVGAALVLICVCFEDELTEGKRG